MLISEANDTNRALRSLLDLRKGAEPGPDTEVREAVERLAARVNKALHAGITPQDIAAGWDAR
ncbi:hypothetical protein [Amycolatopsis sp. cmx-8-4]|uniref:hypothetical protein n=1 Tax=Amycolatopsis sp. cmx-8-4 TaxID=2790947 RepID=UPI00397B3055